MEDRQFAKLLDFFGFSWLGYRLVRKGVKKRVARHMQELGCRSLETYLERLAIHPGARAECERRLAVTISRFFRDLEVWRVLGERVLPELAERGRGSIAIWFAGCSCGEEVYSFRMLLRELASGGRAAPEARLVATDVDPVCLERARRGLYPAGVLRDVDEHRRAGWFLYRGEETYEVSPWLRQEILWLRHNHLSNPPPVKQPEIIFLRNSLLTYFRGEIAAGPLDRIIRCLAPGGFLVTGATEALPDWAKTGLWQYYRCIHQKTQRESLPKGSGIK